jgi:hypothetical protein
MHNVSTKLVNSNQNAARHLLVPCTMLLSIDKAKSHTAICNLCIDHLNFKFLWVMDLCCRQPKHLQCNVLLAGT